MHDLQTTRRLHSNATGCTSDMSDPLHKETYYNWQFPPIGPAVHSRLWCIIDYSPTYPGQRINRKTAESESASRQGATWSLPKDWLIPFKQGFDSFTPQESVFPGF